jgi:hypothetical protein
MVKLF